MEQNLKDEIIKESNESEINQENSNAKVYNFDGPETRKRSKNFFNISHFKNYWDIRYSFSKEL